MRVHPGRRRASCRWDCGGFSDYQQLCTVYPEISAGYVGVSDLSLEFVNVDTHSHTPPQQACLEKYINVAKCNKNTHFVELGVCSQGLQGLLLSPFLGSDNSLPLHPELQ